MVDESAETTQTKPRRITRRQFLKAVGAATSAALTPRAAKWGLEQLASLDQDMTTQELIARVLLPL